MSTFERLERANPVADTDRLLSAPGAMEDFVLAVKNRSGIVQSAEDRPPIEVPTEIETEPPHKDWKRRLVPALVAAVALIAAIGVIVALFNGDDEPDVTDEPVPSVDASEWCRIGDEFSAAFAAGDYGTNIALEDEWIASAPSEIAAATRGLIESLSGGPSTWSGRHQWAEPIAEIEAYRGLHCATADMPGF